MALITYEEAMKAKEVLIKYLEDRKGGFAGNDELLSKLKEEGYLD